MKKICHKVFLNVQAYRSLGLSNLSDIVFEFDNGGKSEHSKKKLFKTKSTRNPCPVSYQNY